MDTGWGMNESVLMKAHTWLSRALIEILEHDTNPGSPGQVRALEDALAILRDLIAENRGLLNPHKAKPAHAE